MPRALRTNRDLYGFVVELSQAVSSRSLEDYLKALWRLGRVDRQLDVLPLSRFGELLARAFHEEPGPFDPAWRETYRQSAEGLDGYPSWEQTILRQVVDLHDMADAGILADKFRYFGVAAPRGSHWFNFDPGTFLECAAAGTFGGWESGDPGGRDYVPGLVAVLDENGQITSVDPRDIDDPTVDLESISWRGFAAFLDSGQMYE